MLRTTANKQLSSAGASKNQEKHFEPGEAFQRLGRIICRSTLSNIESDGCHFDLKGASFLDEKTAEQFARRLCTFFHPKLWSPTVVMCDGDGKEVFRRRSLGTGHRKEIGSKTGRSTAEC